MAHTRGERRPKKARRPTGPAGDHFGGSHEIYLICEQINTHRIFKSIKTQQIRPICPPNRSHRMPDQPKSRTKSNESTKLTFQSHWELIGIKIRVKWIQSQVTIQLQMKTYTQNGRLVALRYTFSQILRRPCETWRPMRSLYSRVFPLDCDLFDFIPPKKVR